MPLDGATWKCIFKYPSRVIFLYARKTRTRPIIATTMDRINSEHLLLEHDYCGNRDGQEGQDRQDNSKENLFPKMYAKNKSCDGPIVKLATTGGGGGGDGGDGGDWNKIIARNLAINKIKYPFLPEQQVRGKVYEKFGIPAVMGAISRRAVAINGEGTIVPKESSKNRKRSDTKIEYFGRAKRPKKFEATATDEEKKGIAVLQFGKEKTNETVADGSGKKIKLRRGSREKSSPNYPVGMPRLVPNYPTFRRFSQVSKKKKLPTQGRKESSIYSDGMPRLTPYFPSWHSRPIGNSDVNGNFTFDKERPRDESSPVEEYTRDIGEQGLFCHTDIDYRTDLPSTPFSSSQSDPVDVDHSYCVNSTWLEFRPRTKKMPIADDADDDDDESESKMFSYPVLPEKVALTNIGNTSDKRDSDENNYHLTKGPTVSSLSERDRAMALAVQTGRLSLSDIDELDSAATSPKKPRRLDSRNGTIIKIDDNENTPPRPIACFPIFYLLSNCCSEYDRGFTEVLPLENFKRSRLDESADRKSGLDLRKSLDASRSAIDKKIKALLKFLELESPDV